MDMNRKWGVRHLLTGWAGYWGVLAATTLTAPLSALWKATQLPEGSASASASFANDVFTATITAYGKSVWTGTASLAALIFWLCGPPLLMWVGWVATRSRRDGRPAAEGEADASPDVFSTVHASRAHASRSDARVPELPSPGLPFRDAVEMPRRVATPVPASDEDAT